MDGDHKPQQLMPAHQAALSPDGRWIAYVSQEDGREEVYVQPFPPGHGGKWMVSTQGGSRPSWRRDGRELFFVAADRRLMSVAVEARDAVFRPGMPRELFRLRGSSYAVAPDGQRFLVSMPAPGPPAAINVVVNWTADLR
jgi:Tol biopolymer transport system component